MKETKVIMKQTFTCDNCSKKTQEYEETPLKNPFPYNEGWIFVYNIEFKLGAARTITIKNKHFCCQQCFINFIKKQIVDFDTSRIVNQITNSSKMEGNNVGTTTNNSGTKNRGYYNY